MDATSTPLTDPASSGLAPAREYSRPAEPEHVSPGALHDLFDSYADIEATLPVFRSLPYATLVVPNGNSTAPFHRWFHLKEAFSADLLWRVLTDCGLVHRPRLVVVDPFVGAGTTLVSLEALRTQANVKAQGYGIERNPFIEFVAECKVRASSHHRSDFEALARAAVEAVRTGDLDPAATPSLSTFSNSSYFPPQVLSQLLELKAAIEGVVGGVQATDLARLCLANVIEPASKLRRDGRALRHEPSKAAIPVLDEFLRWASIVSDDLQTRPLGTHSTVFLGDDRRPKTVLPSGIEADLILFSPPYLNNIDYTEIYKMEAWMLGFLANQHEFREQRRLTMRSHPSVRFEGALLGRDHLGSAFDAIVAPLLHVIPSTKDRTWRARLIVEYFDDLVCTLRQHAGLLREDGSLVCIIGNSVHGTGAHQFVIAADLILARLAEALGFRVDSLQVARIPRRTSGVLPFVRETALFLAKR